MQRAEAEAIYDQGRDVVVALLVRMDEQIRVLTERVARQDERIAQLERRGKRSSRNSSQPPSEDPPGSPPRRGKDPSGRKQGAQDGHEGRGRELLPTAAVDGVVEHWPTGCGCGHVFKESELVAAGDPVRHQVEELPVMAVTVTEHQCQRVCCPDCVCRADTCGCSSGRPASWVGWMGHDGRRVYPVAVFHDGATVRLAGVTWPV